MASKVQKWHNRRREEAKRKEEIDAIRREDKRKQIEFEASGASTPEDEEEEVESSNIAREGNEQPNVSSPHSSNINSRPDTFPLTPPISPLFELPGHSPNLSNAEDATLNKEEVSEEHIAQLCTKIEGLQTQIAHLHEQVKSLHAQLIKAFEKEQEAIIQGEDIEPLLLQIKRLKNSIEERNAEIARLKSIAEDLSDKELKLTKALRQCKIEALERPIVSPPLKQSSEMPLEDHKAVQPNPELDTNPPQKKRSGDKVGYKDYRNRKGGHVRKWSNGEKDSSHIRFKQGSRKPDI